MKGEGGGWRWRADDGGRERREREERVRSRDERGRLERKSA